MAARQGFEFQLFDSRHLLEPLLETEQAAALVKAPQKLLPQYARNGFDAGLRLGKQWRFRAFDLGDCLPHAVNSEQLRTGSHAEQT